MNAPARIPTARDRYIPIVKHHCPGCAGDDLMVRCSILLMRDRSASSMRTCSEDAYGVLAQVQHLASTYAFAAMPSEALAALRYQLVRLISCASGLEAFAFNSSHGGTNEGG